MNHDRLGAERHALRAETRTAGSARGLVAGSCVPSPRLRRLDSSVLSRISAVAQKGLRGCREVVRSIWRRATGDFEPRSTAGRAGNRLVVLRAGQTSRFGLADATKTVRAPAAISAGFGHPRFMGMGATS